MAVFDMITAAPDDIRDQGDAINLRHFTVDTADLADVHRWLEFNPYIRTYALHRGKVVGFFNVMPLTSECGELFKRNELLEEDMRPEHMLMHEALPFAKYAYVAAIAVGDPGSYLHKQCTAAMLAVIADLLLHSYSREHFRILFANPTTFNGNKLVGRLGLKPWNNGRKSLKGNDIYASEMSDEARAGLQALSERYARLVGINPWRKV